MAQIKIGDFVTCYTKGYWQVIDIKPRVAAEDYSSDHARWKKGDTLGQFIIMKKCFTPKMKPKIDFVYEDSYWVKPVSEDILVQIKKYFEENPDYKEKFDNAEVKLRPTLLNFWLDLPEEKEMFLRETLRKLPERYTTEEFWRVAKAYKKYISKPPTKYLLNIFTLPWDLDKKADFICFDWELKKL